MATRGETDWDLNSRLFSVIDDGNPQPRYELGLMTHLHLDTCCPMDGLVQRSRQQLACCATLATAPRISFQFELFIHCAPNTPFHFALDAYFKDSYEKKLASAGRRAALSEARRGLLPSASRTHLTPIQRAPMHGTISEQQEAAPSMARRGQLPRATSFTRAFYYTVYPLRTQYTIPFCPRRILQGFIREKACLGGAAGGTVRSKTWSPAECFQNALDADPTCAYAWNNLGAAGGTVNGKTSSAATCHVLHKSILLSRT